MQTRQPAAEVNEWQKKKKLNEKKHMLIPSFAHLPTAMNVTFAMAQN